MADFIDVPDLDEPKAEKPKGRPRKYATDAEAKSAKRAKDAERKRKARRERKSRPEADELAELQKAYADLPEVDADPDTPPAPSTQPEPVPAPMGHILLAITDTVAPFVIAKAMKRDASRLGLTASEKERLAPLADAAAEKLLAKTDPVKLFVLTVASIYFAKAQALPKLEGRPKPKP